MVFKYKIIRYNLTLSSINNIYIGSGAETQIITNGPTVIESSNIFLGKQSKKKVEDGDQAEPLVLGNKLKIFLEDIISILESAHALVQGVPVPLTDSMAAPLVSKIQSVKNKLSTPDFWSEYHYIEDNGQKTE